MERVKVLIDKLIQQQQRNESIDAMLLTTQLLQNELLLLQKNNTAPVAKKVAVVMPSGANPVIKREPKPAPEIKAEEPIPVQKEVPQPAQPEPVQNVEVPIQSNVEQVHRQEENEPEPASEVPPVLPSYRVPPAPQITPVFSPAPEHEAYLPPKPKIQETPPEPEKVVHPLVMDNQFDAIEDTPTLAQYQPSKKDLKLQKEINDLVGESKETLNDRLKENKKELAHILKETPIKDLRKAIGVNDRFVFVNELFRGDETMYERSIKTINGFHILPEAEYWINRELKVKLGWDDYKDSVQHFYHLVRRRFS